MHITGGATKKTHPRDGLSARYVISDLQCLYAVLGTSPAREVKMNEELEKLQGTWNIMTLEVEGQNVSAAFFTGARIVVKGDNFSTVSMGAPYAGTLALDVTGTPKTFDILFKEGP